MGDKDPFKRWRKRWFECKGFFLYYYLPDKREKPKGIIPLNKVLGVTVTPATVSKSNLYTFQINTSKRIYYLGAESQSKRR